MLGQSLHRTGRNYEKDLMNWKCWEENSKGFFFLSELNEQYVFEGKDLSYTFFVMSMLVQSSRTRNRVRREEQLNGRHLNKQGGYSISCFRAQSYIYEL